MGNVLSRRSVLERGVGLAAGALVASTGVLALAVDARAKDAESVARGHVQRVLKELNAWRRRTGAFDAKGNMMPLAPVALDARMGDDLLAYLRYLLLNGFDVVGSESPGKTGYTTGGARAAPLSGIASSGIGGPFKRPTSFFNMQIGALWGRVRLSKGMTVDAYRAQIARHEPVAQTVGIAYLEGRDPLGNDRWVLGINTEGLVPATLPSVRPIIAPTGKDALRCYVPERAGPIEAPGWFEYGNPVTATFHDFPVRFTIENPDVGLGIQRGRRKVKVPLVEAGVFQQSTLFGIPAEPLKKRTTYEMQMSADLKLFHEDDLRIVKEMVQEETCFEGMVFRFRHHSTFRTGKHKI